MDPENYFTNFLEIKSQENLINLGSIVLQIIHESVEIFLNYKYVLSLFLKVYFLTFVLYISSVGMKRKINLSIKYVLEVILCNLTVLLMSPLIIIVILSLKTIRYILSLYLHLTTKGRVRLVDNSDSFWACDEHVNTNYMYLLCVIEGQSSLSIIKKKIERLLKFQNFLASKSFSKMKCKIFKRFGFFCWKNPEENFNLNNHVEYLDPQEPFKEINKTKILKKLEEIYDYPLPDRDPKWKIYYISNFTYNDESSNDCSIQKEDPKYCAFVGRIHHAYMDGISWNNVFNWLLFDYPSDTALDCFKEPSFSWIQKILINLKLIIFGPHLLISSIMLKENHCFHGPKLTGPKTLGMSRSFNLDTLKNMKNNTNSSITALQLTGLGGGMRRLALKKGYKVPKTIATSVTAAMFPYGNSLQPENRFTVARMPIDIGLEDLPTRLDSAVKSAKILSKSIEFLMVHKLVKFVGLFPAKAIEYFINQTHVTLILSNIPGVKNKIHLNGKEVKEFVIWNVIKGCIGLGVGIYSYADRVCAGFIGDAAILSSSDLHDLIKEYENEMEDLAEHAGVSKSLLFID